MSEYGCCPGETSNATADMKFCKNKCIYVSNEKLEEVKNKALVILKDTNKDVQTKLKNVNKIIYENKYKSELINCSPCYKKIIDTAIADMYIKNNMHKI